MSFLSESRRLVDRRLGRRAEADAAPPGGRPVCWPGGLERSAPTLAGRERGGTAVAHHQPAAPCRQWPIIIAAARPMKILPSSGWAGSQWHDGAVNIILKAISRPNSAPEAPGVGPPPLAPRLTTIGWITPPASAGAQELQIAAAPDRLQPEPNIHGPSMFEEQMPHVPAGRHQVIEPPRREGAAVWPAAERPEREAPATLQKPSGRTRRTARCRSKHQGLGDGAGSGACRRRLRGSARICAGGWTEPVACGGRWILNHQAH